MNTKISARDFFLQVGAIVSFYASAIALITLLFEAINFAYPKITNAYQYYFPSISLQVATLIVAFPLFLFLSWLLQKTYVAEPGLKENQLRKWLSYVTLFVAGAVVAGDLITLIYTFLDGRELTTAFILKVFTLLLVAGAIFFYYLREIRNRIDLRERNIWRGVSTIIVIGSIVLGFAVVGSPATQRAKRFDLQRVSDLQGIQWQIVNYWQQKERLPQTLDELKDPISSYNLPIDPKTSRPYEYSKTGNLSFSLCAEFERESLASQTSTIQPAYAPDISVRYPESQSWQHAARRTCFDRTVDPELYPPVKTLRQ